ncbi:MAG: alpha-1,2-fucosyltransferase [Flavobacteriaceae bacterium]|nr:alpha-1,2-fucosyltransferase [Flavobacteriaceae bacterium]
MQPPTVFYDRTGGYTGFLGNVMFQTAAAIGIATKNNMPYLFPHKDYLDIFTGNIPRCIPSEIANLPFQTVAEQGFHYSDITLDPNADVNYNLNGYFQSQKYWQHCEELIHQLFQFKEDEYFIFAKPQESLYPVVSIHVRRGDYLKHPDSHPTLPAIYYINAVQQIKDLLGKTELHLAVFSDDMAWCKEHFTQNSMGLKSIITFIEGQNQAQDLCMMASADHHIIANSSFSWWGSYLSMLNKKYNNEPNPLIVAPTQDKWFGQAYKHHNLSDLYMDNWILL